MKVSRVKMAGVRKLKVTRDREKAVESLRLRARPLPLGFKFDRQEANERWEERNAST
jgi:hypothetical protein